MIDTDSSDEDTPIKESSVKETKYFSEVIQAQRWWVVLIFFLFASISNLSGISLLATGGPSMEYLNIGENELLSLAEITLVCVILFSSFGAWYAHKHFKETFLICMLITVSGCWIRVFAGTNFTWVIISQILISTGSAPTPGIAMLIPERWFPVNERFIALNLTISAGNVGWFLSYIIPPLVIGDDASKIPMYVLFQAIFLSIPFILGLFSLSDRPKVPPSYTALVKMVDPSSFTQEIKTLFSKPTFWPFIMTFGIVLGSGYSTMAVSGIVTRELEFSNFHQSVLGSCYVGVGVIAGTLATILLAKKALRHDPIIKILVTISFFGLIVTEFLLQVFEVLDVALIVVCHAVIGIGLIGLTPFAFDSLTESTFPVQESISGNALAIIQCLSTTIINLALLIPFVASNGFGMLGLLMLPCWIYIMFYFKTDYKRQKIDRTHTEIDELAKRSIAVIESQGKLSMNDYHNFVNSMESVE